MFIPVQTMREAFYQVWIFTAIKLAIELVVFLNAAFEWPMPKIGILRLAVLTDGNVRVEIL